ncbi:MAG: site-2 protease family protein [Gemmataceae bacterium]|nr:site-2 protease family protein [Gemmataceae bacterium]
MDPNANAGHPDPVNTPSPAGEGATAGAPDHGQEVSALQAWLRANAFSLVTTAVAVALVCIYLDPFDTLKVVLGLGFIVFIHELGHFLAAKWCDVHVNTFSIGFGPAVPFCQYKWGETTYKIGIIPLGGFVQMVGEGDGADGEEAEDDPRSFRKKTVGQRMLIISAGVVMNVLFGLGCFIAAYLHGVRETPAVVWTVESGGAAWRADLRTGDRITEIGGRANPSFDDIRPIVMSSQKDERVSVEWERNGVKSGGRFVQPLRDEGQLFPQLGVSPPPKLTLLLSPKRVTVRPVIPGSPAEAASDGGEQFQPGDRVVGMTDPANLSKVTAVADYAEYHRRMVRLAGEDVVLHVRRHDAPDDAKPVAITLKPAFRHDLGVRMRMGEVVALRAGGSAEGAGLVARSEGATPTRGDRIAAVLLPPDDNGVRVCYANGAAGLPKDNNIVQKPLDPLLLPHQLNQWAAGREGKGDGKPTLELVVIRQGSPADTTERVSLAFDPSYRFDRETQLYPNSPVPLSGLGLAYWVEGVVDDVAPGGPAAGVLQSNDVITGVRLKSPDGKGGVKEGEWKDDLRPNQWAAADAAFQVSAPEIDLKVKRGEGEMLTVTVAARPHRYTDQKHPEVFPVVERGLLFQSETQTHRAADVGDAIVLGAHRTVRFIKSVYMNLYSMVFGRVSVKTMSGPLRIADASYKLAGEDFWQFLLFLGLISVNLAVVNFLPIPVLDGGHMVFLILEKVLGRPVPERLFAIAMYTGLVMILSLMLFVLFRDAKFFGWF